MSVKAKLGIDAYPLYWPEGQKRTGNYSRETSRFGKTFAIARDELLAEMHRIQGTNRKYSYGNEPIISTNITLRRDGLPLANQRAPEDPGVAAYFERSGKPVCIACDRFKKVEENMQAIAKTIEAMRGIERWGSSALLDKAFAGFEALPNPQLPWAMVLGISATAPWVDIEQAYMRKRSATHPDRGGSAGEFDAVTKAWEEAQKARRMQ